MKKAINYKNTGMHDQRYLDTIDRIFFIFYTGHNICDFLDFVVQSVVSLTSSLVVKMVTVLVSIISYSQVFLLKKKVTHIFLANILAYMPYLTIKV